MSIFQNPIGLLKQKIDNLQGVGTFVPQMTLYHLLSWFIVQEILYTLASWLGASCTFSAFGTFSSPFADSSILVQERKYSFPRDLRNEWQIEIWVALHDGRTDERWTHGRTTADAVQTILLDYSIWTLNVCLCPSPAQTLNNTFGAKNSSTFSIALDDPSSIWTNIPCTCALTIRQTISKNPIIIFGTMYSHLTNDSL